MVLSASDLDALDRAIASSELEVEVDGRRVRYRSMSELMKARQHVEDAVRRQAPAAARSVFRFNMTTARGD